MTAGRLAVLVGAVACSAATESEATSADGTWTYGATQQAPVPATVSGTLSLVGVGGGGAFEGTLAAVEQTAAGETRPATGTVAGRVVADTVLDFDVVLSGVARRHLGVRRGDSVSGTWTTVSGSAASGRFGLRRR